MISMTGITDDVYFGTEFATSDHIFPNFEVDFATSGANFATSYQFSPNGRFFHNVGPIFATSAILKFFADELNSFTAHHFVKYVFKTRNIFIQP